MTGAFRHYVDVFARGDQRDASQQVVGAPAAKIRNVPCSIEVVNGGEVRRGQQMQAETNTLIVMRFIEDRIKPTDKLVQHGTGKEINVLAAYDPDGRRRETIVQGRSKA